MPLRRKSEPEPKLQLMPIGQAAMFIGVSTRTLERYEARGQIVPYRLPNGRRRFRRSDLETLLLPAATEDTA